MRWGGTMGHSPIQQKNVPLTNFQLAVFSTEAVVLYGMDSLLHNTDLINTYIRNTLELPEKKMNK